MYTDCILGKWWGSVSFISIHNTIVKSSQFSSTLFTILHFQLNLCFNLSISELVINQLCNLIDVLLIDLTVEKLILIQVRN
ncbi:hypothetical protein QVD17_06278 [Tagetes erecta]|uniref:Uncharacterized protein n=1 Tax=Tagetes erecta TaxID=13708 RepID=A0AAD8LJV4_TARER|nr:hypothetical protein QVD17_06278 [Tagetes erecta]